MIDIGIDFGSTYTTVSVYHTESKNLEALSLSQGSPYIPSVVAMENNQFEYGRAAKSRTGRKNVTIFKAFKMMLPEQDKRKLAARGYGEVNTPEKIAKYFLETILKQVLEDSGEEQIGKLVVGVPEIWNNDLNTLDGRSMVRNICQSMGVIKTVQVVSEPAAASAFFAYNFQIMTGKPLKEIFCWWIMAVALWILH